MWSQQKYIEKHSSLEIMYSSSQKEKKKHLGKYTKKWFGPYKVQFCLPNNIMLLVTLHKFDPNIVL
jgi:hypothetical protein